MIMANSKQVCVLLLIAVFALSTLAGCSSGTNEPAAPPKPPASAATPEQTPDSVPAPDETPVIYTVPDYGGSAGNYSVTIPAGANVSDNLETFGSMSIKLRDGSWIMLISSSTQTSLEAEEENSRLYGYETRPYTAGTNEALLVIRDKSDGTVTVSLNFVSPSEVPQLGLIETGGITDIDEYLNDPIVRAIIGSIDKPADMSETGSNAESVEMAAYSTASLNLKAPAGWFEVINETKYGIESWRLVETEDWLDNFDTKMITISFGEEGKDYFNSILEALNFDYIDLQEPDKITIGGVEWRHFYASLADDGKDGESTIFNGYGAWIGVRLLFVEFEWVESGDPLIEAVLSSVKAK